MDRINTPTAGPNINGANRAGFRDEDAAAGVQATRLNARWFNNVQEEIINIIESEGINLDGTVQSQLNAAITAKIEKAVEGAEGIITARSRLLAGTGGGRSSRPDFIRAITGANQARVFFPVEAPLTLRKGRRTNVLSGGQFDILNLPSSPTGATGLTLNIPDGDYASAAGELGYILDQATREGEWSISSVGAVIAGGGGEPGRIGQECASRIVPGSGSPEYFFAKVKDATTLEDVRRGYFLSRDGDPSPRIGSSSIRGVALMELIHIFRDLTNENFLALTSSRIYESGTTPGSPSNDDLWLNTSTGVWSRRVGSNWEVIDVVKLGYAVMDGSSCVGTKSLELSLSLIHI